MKRILPVLLLLPVFALPACGGGVSMHAPDGFAQLDDQKDYAYRATNAQGVVIAVRHKANKPRGDLKFWAGAVDAHLRRKGYTAVTGSDVKTANGMTGQQIRYKVVRGNREHAFWVTVFVVDDAVITVEVGGDHAFFESLEEPIKKAIESLEVS